MTFGLLFRCGLFFHSFGIYFLIVWSLVMLHFIMEMSGWLPQNSAIILGEYVCSSYEIVCLNWWCIVCKKKTHDDINKFLDVHVFACTTWNQNHDTKSSSELSRPPRACHIESPELFSSEESTIYFMRNNSLVQIE